jgi:hypothetical protein
VRTLLFSLVLLGTACKQSDPAAGQPPAAHLQQQDGDLKSYALIYVRKNLDASRAKQLVLGLPRDP